MAKDCFTISERKGISEPYRIAISNIPDEATLALTLVSHPNSVIYDQRVMPKDIYSIFIGQRHHQVIKEGVAHSNN